MKTYLSLSLCLFSMLFSQLSHAQLWLYSGSGANYVTCGRNVVLVDHDVDISTCYINIEIYQYSLTTSSLVFSQQALLTDQFYFEVLGSITFPSNGETVDGYRLKNITGYNTLQNYAQTTILLTPVTAISGVFASDERLKACSCPDAPGRIAYFRLYQSLEPFIQYLFSVTSEPDFNFDGWGNDLPLFASLLNWYVDNSVTPSESDWENVLDANNLGDITLPEGFGVPGIDCGCWREIYDYYSHFIGYFIQEIQINSGNAFPISVLDSIRHYTGSGCKCSAMYSPELHSLSWDGVDHYFIALNPVFKAFLPAILIHIAYDNGQYYTAMGYSLNYQTIGSCLNHSDCIYFEYITYDNHAFDYGEYFQPFTDNFSDYCSEDCNDCITSFSPIPGNEYVLSAWVKEDLSEPVEVVTYESPYISIQFDVSPDAGPFYASGPIIDGWQKIESKFTIPPGSTTLRLVLGSGSTTHAFFDDIRINPKSSNMKSYVYDHISKKLVAELDEQNFATLYEYDQEGKLVRVKKESERGVLTIKENRNNTPKKP